MHTYKHKTISLLVKNLIFTVCINRPSAFSLHVSVALDDGVSQVSCWGIVLIVKHVFIFGLSEHSASRLCENEHLNFVKTEQK